MDHVRETFLPKDDVFQVKRILDDASGGHSNTKHVLLRRHERRHGNPVNVSQVTVTLEDKVLSLILEKGDVSIPLPGSHPDSERLLLRFMRSSPPPTVLERIWVRNFTSLWGTLWMTLSLPPRAKLNHCVASERTGRKEWNLISGLSSDLLPKAPPPPTRALIQNIGCRCCP